LEAAVSKAQGIAEVVEKAEAYRDEVVPAMQSLRSDIDALEMLVPRDMWPIPTYAELLFKL
jgi:glutamine synthetase